VDQPFFKLWYRPEELGGFVILGLKAVKEVGTFSVKFIEGSQ
jgi:hypothetical protein